MSRPRKPWPADDLRLNEWPGDWPFWLLALAILVPAGVFVGHLMALWSRTQGYSTWA